MRVAVDLEPEGRAGREVEVLLVLIRAGGAVAGGLIGHNVKGALIDGAIGAGGGYIIGIEQRRADEKKRAAWRRAHPKHKRHYTKTTTTTTTIENH